MTHRYKIRTFESRERDRSLAEGTVVLPIDGSFWRQAASIDDIERMLCEGVLGRRLASGRIYQICPLIGNPETIRSVAIDEKATARRVTLDASQGLYSVYRLVRYPEEMKAQEQWTPDAEAVEA